MNDVLRTWNGMPFEAAAEAVLPCNGSVAWARGVAALRPFTHPQQIFNAADAIWRALPPGDWQQAFDSHPRLGEAHVKQAPAQSAERAAAQGAEQASAQSLAWSEGEQRALGSEAGTRAALAEGNRRYEARFGRVFLLCAMGKSGSETLSLLRRRCANDPETELLEAVEEGRRITQLRLRKWMVLPPAGCEDV